MYKHLGRYDGDTRVFTCMWYSEVARLVGEVEYLRQMMESMNMVVTGQGLEEKGGDTGYRSRSRLHIFKYSYFYI